MISAIHTALSGLPAIGKQIEVIAHNIANVNTDGFKKPKTGFVKIPRGGRPPCFKKAASPGPTVLRDTGGNQTMVELSNVDLGEEVAQQIAAQRSFEANLQTLRTGDALLGSILDIKK
jgi:flagellar basal-body rod protein FlgC